MDETLEVIEARAEALVDADTALLRALVKMRKSRGLTQDQVAERMMVSQPAVAQFERYDANPKLSTLRRYALAVGARVHHVVIDDALPVTSDVWPEVRLTQQSPLTQSVQWEPEHV